MDKVRFGIVGVGAMGGAHAKNLLEGKVTGGTLGAVYDIEPARTEKLAEEHPEVTVFDSASAMFKSGAIDAVLIATPHYFHPPIAMEAFLYGLHVMTEKPAGVYTKQVREMNEAAAEAKVVFGIMYNQRTDSVYRKMREMVYDGELGELKRTNWIITNWYRPEAYYKSGSWRATWRGEGGGVLLNQCPHNLDLWQWICGMPHKVTAFCHEGKWHDIEVEDDVTAYVEYENGATGVFVTCTADAPGTNRFEITGDKGKLVCENGKLEFYSLATPEREFNKENKIPFNAPKSSRSVVKTDGTNPQHVGILNAFADKILGGAGELYARGEEGINGLTLSNAMHLSSWLGKTVALPLDEELFLSELKKKYRKFE
uniref:Gluconokinase/oxidoreductase domain protein n=1 Tax=uncultured bacterium contig00025 TaxID=1181514 RepID=A0A806K1H4_9BACT|nr:gluconokinase/oxidoreductase domain protein [uncultured bacterium contig00025]